MKKPMNWITRIGVFALIIALGSCATRSGLGGVDLAHVYQKDGLLVRPEIRLYHTDEYHTNVYFSFSSEELLYVRPGVNQPFYANVDVQVYVYENFSRSSIIDTAKINLKDSQQVLTPKRITGSLEVEINDNTPLEEYVLLIRFHDKNRKIYFDEIRLLERSDPYNRQNFLLLDQDDNVVYKDQVQLGKMYKVVSNQDVDQLHVKYYNREFDLAKPPFVIAESDPFNYKADSTFTVANGDTFILNQPGFYHFQTDPSIREGYTLYHYYPSFPLVTMKSHLIGPIRYLSTNLEYEGVDLNSTDSAKIEADKFWLRHAGSEDRARGQIEEFYGRVEAANTFFSSYQPGWRTDRGILYVVYGPPTKIYRTKDTEIWVYGQENSSLNFTFVFDRMINPFSDNDYSLRRKTEYRYGWGLAVDAWRHGRIFDEVDIKKAQDERDQQLRQTASPYLWN